MESVISIKVVFGDKVFWNYAAIFQNRKLPGLLFPARLALAMIDRAKPEPRPNAGNLSDATR